MTAPNVAEKPLPNFYHLMLSKAELEVVVVLTCNLIACHVVGMPEPLITVGCADADEGGTAVHASVVGKDDVLAHASRGVGMTLRRFRDSHGDEAFSTLANRLTKLLLASLKQEGI